MGKRKSIWLIENKNKYWQELCGTKHDLGLGALEKSWPGSCICKFERPQPRLEEKY